jgi:spore coat protein U domain-containing protein, fimbrial subunit CupE1/2/3/6
MQSKVRPHKRGILFLLLVICFPASLYGANCTISDISIAFGGYDPVSPQTRDSSTTVQVTCSGSNETVTFDLLASAGMGTFSDRQASNTRSMLHYNLFLDASRTQIWGDGSNGTIVLHDSLTITSTPVTKDYVIYGRIVARQQTATAGNYTDQITTTMRY